MEEREKESKFFNSSAMNRGELHLKLHLLTTPPHQLLSSPSPNRIRNVKISSLRQHRRLLRALVAHELLRRPQAPAPYSWRDDFAPEAAQILAQHAVQCRLDRDQTAMARWLVYCEVHRMLPLDHRCFVPLLERLRRKFLQAHHSSSSGRDSAAGASEDREEDEEERQSREFHAAADDFADE